MGGIAERAVEPECHVLLSVPAGPERGIGVLRRLWFFEGLGNHGDTSLLVNPDHLVNTASPPSVGVPARRVRVPRRRDWAVLGLYRSLGLELKTMLLGVEGEDWIGRGGSSPASINTVPDRHTALHADGLPAVIQSRDSDHKQSLSGTVTYKHTRRWRS